MKSSASGSSTAIKTTQSYTDYIGFWGGPYPTAYDDTDFAGNWNVDDSLDPAYKTYQDALTKDNGITGTETLRSGITCARLRSDLYQLGLGPRVAWHITDWLDAYGSVEALCNIVHMEVDVGNQGSTDTQCLLGFGGHLGLAGYFTDNLGLYAEVGYEWIDKAETDLGAARMDVDYSSLIVSAGAIFRF